MRMHGLTAPDHRPYLLATDLRTAEDVARWLRTYHPCEQLGDAVDDLRTRLDRERRQACRRGARYEITMARGFRGRGGEATAIGTVLERTHIDRALAFRREAAMTHPRGASGVLDYAAAEHLDRCLGPVERYETKGGEE